MQSNDFLLYKINILDAEQQCLVNIKHFLIKITK